jgi:Secretion system C-terminal sorting domain
MLKKIIFILSFIIGINCTSFAQNRTTSNDGTAQVKMINAYPNPATTVVNFAFQKDYNRTYSIQILNSIGKVMYSGKNMPSFLSIDLKAEKFYRGIYIYQLLDRNGIVVESGKILVVN